MEWINDNQESMVGLAVFCFLLISIVIAYIYENKK